MYFLNKTFIVIMFVVSSAMTFPMDGFISRAEWNAFVPKHILLDSHEPFSLIVVKYIEVKHKDCNLKYDKPCIEAVRKLQSQTMMSGYSDIPYNFVIDPFGNVFEGLGWYNLDHEKKHSLREFRTIGFMGSNKAKEVTDKQLIAVENIFRNGLKLKILHKTYHFFGEQDLEKTMKLVKYKLQVKIDAVDAVDDF